MLENDHVPKTVPPPGLFDRAVADGLDRGSGGSRVIDALMRLMCFKNRMLAVHGIPRGNPRERQRSLQEGLFEAFALGVEEGFAVFRGEVIGFVRFPLIGERRPEHFAVALKLIFPEPLFNQQGKTVTFAQVLDEVDLRSENIRNAHGQNGRFTGRGQRLEQTGTDGSAYAHQTEIIDYRLDVGDKPFIRFRDNELLAIVDLVFEAFHVPAVRGADQRVGLPCAEVVERVKLSRHIQKLLDGTRGHIWRKQF